MVFFSKNVDFCPNTHFVLHFFPLLAHCVRGKGAYLFGVFCQVFKTTIFSCVARKEK